MQNAARETWDTYTATWTADRDARAALFEASLDPGATYTDPLVHTESWDALHAYMDAFQARFPGAGFATRWFQMHHGRSVAHWHMVAPDGTVLSEGTSFGTWGDDGRLHSMTGFYEVLDA